MTREQLRNHSMISHKDGCFGIDIIKVSDVKSSVTQLLRLIYNDADFNRQGDIAAYLSSKTSPEIREYIRQNILQQVQTSPSQLNMSDDEIAEFVRDAGESRFAYAERMRLKFEAARSDVGLLKSQSKSQ